MSIDVTSIILSKKYTDKKFSEIEDSGGSSLPAEKQQIINNLQTSSNGDLLYENKAIAFVEDIKVYINETIVGGEW